MEHAIDIGTQALAIHLKSLREARELTLSDVAALSSLSRATLSRIENGETSPTAETLGRLATAYAVPISQLLQPMEKVFQPVIKRADQSAWEDPDVAFVRRSVSPPSGQLSLELIECRIGPDQRISYPAPAVPGQEHHLYMLLGALEVTVEGVSHALRPGDCLRYKLFGTTAFETGVNEAHYLIALS